VAPDQCFPTIVENSVWPVYMLRNIKSEHCRGMYCMPRIMLWADELARDVIYCKLQLFWQRHEWVIYC